MRSLSFLPHVGPIATAVISVLGSVQVLSFLFIFVIFMFAFTISTYWVFGNQLDAYRSLHQSIIRVMTLAFGEEFIIYDLMAQTYLYTGTLLWMLIVAFMNVLLCNTFIAVINAAYEERLRESQGNWFRKIKTVYQVKSLGFAVVSGADKENTVQGHLICRTFCRLLGRCVTSDWIKYYGNVDDIVPDYFGDGASPISDKKSLYNKVLEVPHSGVWMVEEQERPKSKE